MKHPHLMPVLLCALVLLSACAPQGNSNVPPSTLPAVSPSAAPGDVSAAPGILSDFATTGLDGSDADQSIFAGHSVTMVNVWATFCPPCIDEMPDLAELNQDYADRGFQVVGLISDVLNQDGSLSESQLDTARDIVEATGADYLHLLPAQGLFALLGQVDAVPTTLFVDENGAQIGYAFQGARSKEDWATIIEPLLPEVE